MTTIYTHHDADGIVSAFFTSFGVKNSEIVVTEKFGDTSNWKDGDYMTDMRPDNPSIKGTVLDHHLPHSKDRKYKLITHLEDLGYNAPASLITWLEFKDKIPQKEWWKLTIGLGGDSQLEKTPAEVLKLNPILLKEVKTSVYNKYGKITINTYPIMQLLSSYINALLRINKYEEALNLLMFSPNPISILQSEEAIEAKEAVKSEFERILRTNADVYHFNGLTLVLFDSTYRLSGYIASAIGSDNSCILAINTSNGSASMRGKLALYYKDILKDVAGLELDGHPGFMGGSYTESTNKLIDALSKL